jgi:alpha-tubulin suppressor-like RCC1 family protein
MSALPDADMFTQNDTSPDAPPNQMDMDLEPRVIGPQGCVLQLTASADHTYAVWESGAGLCWGSNGRGQLGSGLGNAFSPIGVALPRGRHKLFSNPR